MVIANVTRGVGHRVSLLRDCGLENRIVFSFEDFEQRIDELISPIDYTQVEELLKRKTESFQFLCKAINNELHDVDSKISVIVPIYNAEKHLNRCVVLFYRHKHSLT